MIVSSQGRPRKYNPGSPNYGYEFWITVGPEEQGDGEARIAEFGGGLYAVTRVTLISAPYDQIPAGWRR